MVWMKNIDIMNKIDLTFGKKENLVIFAKINKNNKELIIKIKRWRLYFKSYNLEV